MPEIEKNDPIYEGARVEGACPNCAKPYVRQAHAGHECGCGWKEGSEDSEAGDGLDANTVAEMKKIAADEEIALDPKAKKPEIIAAIREARDMKAASDTDNAGDEE
jgi:hypothetical protein